MFARLLAVIGRPLADTASLADALDLAHFREQPLEMGDMTTLEDIARVHAGWIIWRSDAGRWWATRRGAVDLEAIRRGCAMTLDADDPEGLAAALTAQEEVTAEIVADLAPIAADSTTAG